MDFYDPDKAPDPEQWLQLDEYDRIDLVVEYHEENGIELPDVEVHAGFHVAVENQLALPHPPAVRAMARLLQEGLSRHEAIHAIASVLTHFLFEAAKSDVPPSPEEGQARIDADLDALTVAEWHRKFAD